MLATVQLPTRPLPLFGVQEKLVHVLALSPVDCSNTGVMARKLITTWIVKAEKSTDSVESGRTNLTCICIREP